MNSNIKQNFLNRLNILDFIVINFLSSIILLLTNLQILIMIKISYRNLEKENF